MLDKCRLCGGSINKTYFSVSLNDEIDLNVTFNDMIEYYCHIKLDDNSSLSQQICFVCKSIIENFIKFCDKTENFQLKLKAVKKDTNFQKIWIVENHDIPKVDENSNKEVTQGDPVINNEIQIRNKRRRKKGHSVEEIFKEELDNRSAYKLHLKVPLCHVLPNGQLSDEGVNCLADKTTWKDHKYNCKHCSFKFELPALLEHLEHEISDARQRSIECPQCLKGFAFINSYINHVIVKHNEDIAFNCIGCSLFFHNIPSLINHYKDQHYTLYTDKIFPCLICRSYSILSHQLKNHRLKHFRKNKNVKSELNDLNGNKIPKTKS